MSRSLVTAGIAVIALIGGLVVASYFGAPPQRDLEVGVLLPSPRVLPDLAVIDEGGTARSLAAFRGEWTLVFPGFTYCPDICPTTLAQLAALPPQVAGLKVRLFSIDPERDSPERLAEYVRFFHPDFGAFTLPEPDLAAAARALAVVYMKVPTGDDDSYTMDHSSALTLINPQGQVQGFFTPPFDIDAMARDLQRLIKT